MYLYMTETNQKGNERMNKKRENVLVKKSGGGGEYARPSQQNGPARKVSKGHCDLPTNTTTKNNTKQRGVHSPVFEVLPCGSLIQRVGEITL